MSIHFKSTQYACAVLLIVSSIALAFIEAFRLDDLPTGVLWYIAQAFLLAGSIFGLDYYVKRLSYVYRDKGDSQQKPIKFTDRQ